ncbi:MAG: sucrase ferredoxin [Actinomycetota bacterium]
MTSIDHLLPSPETAVRCAEHARSLAIDPGGTAIRADRVVLVSTPAPWPKPVFDHPRLAAVEPLRAAPAIPTRVLATWGPQGRSADGPTDEVIAFDRPRPGVGAEVIERRFTARTDAALAEVVAALAADDRPRMDALARTVAPVAEPVVMICTQGSHDVCCGSEGTRLAAEVSRWLEGVTVYRVSHTGGHRFAPTALTLPDGRMWAGLDRELVRRILRRVDAPAELLGHCRGWWGADTGPAQVAERAVLGVVGWSVDDDPAKNLRTVEVQADPDGATYRCVVTVGDSSWAVTVTAGRTVPTIACRQPGGLPAKPATEYQVGEIVPGR